MLQRQHAALQAHESEWDEVDEYFRSRLAELAEAVTGLQAEMEEVYPGRAKRTAKGATA